MAIVKANYTKSSGAAKAHIRYIQHRPGRTVPGKTEGKPMTHSTHAHCCELAEVSNPEQLWYVQTYHDLHCKIYSPEYRLQYYTGGWSSPDKTRNKAPQKDKLVNNLTASGDSKAGTTPGKENERRTRTLFGIDGRLGRYDAYRMIDSAEKGSVFFRFILSPDPTREDTEKDLRLWEVAEKTMHTLEERLQKQVSWVAVEHNDHTPHRHVHIVAIVEGRLQAQDFQSLRQSATQACLEQRQELDLTRARAPGKEGALERSV
jgi:hypothetical protein